MNQEQIEKDFFWHLKKGDRTALAAFLAQNSLTQETLVKALSAMVAGSSKADIFIPLMDLLEDKNNMPNMAKRWIIWNERTDLAERWQLDAQIFMKNSSPENPSNEFIVRSGNFHSVLREQRILRELQSLKKEVIELRETVNRLSPRPARQGGTKFNLD